MYELVLVSESKQTRKMQFASFDEAYTEWVRVCKFTFTAHLFGPSLPDEGVILLQEGKTQCHSCNGSGKYYGGGVIENGVYKGFVGTCYRCEGKGYQTGHDIARNDYYDAHFRRVSE